MSAPRVFLQNFEEQKGLDYKGTPLTDELKSPAALTNWRYGEGRSLRGRNGCKFLGQGNAFTGIHNYTYFDSSSGATVEEIIGINHHLWRLTSTTITIGRASGSTVWDGAMSLDSATGRFRFVLTQGGVDITLVHPITGESNAYLDLGTGLEKDEAPTAAPTSGCITILDLCQAIDAHANFTCAAPTKTARSNGNQTWTAGGTINVDSGHTVSAGDFIWFWDHTQGRLDFRRVSATAATTLTMGPGQPDASVKNDQVLGLGAAPAASNLFGLLSGSDPSKTYTFYYWEPIYSSRGALDLQATANYQSYEGLFEDAWADRASSNATLPTLVNGDQAAFIFTQNASTQTKNYTNYPCKYDGQSVYRAGLPPVARTDVPIPILGLPPTLSVATAGSLTGTFKYTYRFIHKDKRGIVTACDDFVSTLPGSAATLETGSITSIDPLLSVVHPVLAVSDGEMLTINATATVTTITVVSTKTAKVGDYVLIPTSATTYTVRTITAVPTATTLTISGSAVSVTSGNRIFINPNLGFNDRGGRCNGVSTAATSITLHQHHNIYVGDVIYLYDRLHSQYTERTITSVTATTVSWSSGAPVTTADGDLISAGLRLELYRTKNGGNTFFLLETLPAPFFPEKFDTPYLGYSDSKSDSNLGAEIDIPPIGKERGLPPKAGVGCLHQGLMIYSKIKDQPNTVAYSNLDSLETVSAAEGSTDVPSTISGLITAVFSDTNDRLLAFKNRAIYEIIGDLDSLGYIVNPIREGDFGVASQGSLQRVNGVVIGVGPSGFVGLRGGQLLLNDDGDSLVGAPINTAIRNNLSCTRARAINDFSNGIYLCTIPDTVYGTTNGGDLIFALDYLNGGKWFDYDYNGNVQPASGLIMSGGHRYHLSDLASGNIKSGHLFVDGLAYSTDYRFADNHLAINYEWITGWEHLGDPDTDKEFLELVLWSFPGVWEEGLPDFDGVGTTFVLSITEEGNLFDTDYGFTAIGTHSVTFTNNVNPAQMRKVVKLKNTKLKFTRFRFTNNTIGQCPFISGLSVDIAEAYNKEHMRDQVAR